ncbi:MAG: 50S ribosomal protein L17 [Verrucomicrobiota bacterium]
MRHLKRTVKLGRKSQHRDAMLANLACSLIQHGRVTTTLAKAKAMKPLVDKIVTIGKKGDLHHRRLAVSKLKHPATVKKLFADVAPRFKDRQGGYTRILKLGPRYSDSAKMALIEWVDFVAPVEAPAVAKEPKGKKENTETKD